MIDDITIIWQYYSNVNPILYMKKKPLAVYLDETERKKLEDIAQGWGMSLSSALKRLVREK
ncbi:hypothetical protein OA07_01515 [Aphanizomenon flos-aquae 2012/KM1/D3]|nr:hypothetical protein OA07_20765 [Aphanizomenon flos-aquae 2012/KM1/D3]KHG43028.1 hypothetical protein OA07_01515 [Aphanizomenon flos-aquae 2012/KM1/D3]